jgi:RNA polymerase sigma-70 factor (ECF subfamily)
MLQAVINTTQQVKPFAREEAIEDAGLDNSVELDKFLQGIQSRAFRIAHIATGNPEDALDLVQDAMFKLVEKYAQRPSNEWTPLFYRILNSKIKDGYRRNKVRNRYRSWLSGSGSDNENFEDPIQTAPDPRNQTPESESVTNESMEKLQAALDNLPPRQQQAFLLRAWEGLNVRQTATAMDCAEGSVKTHYSRAVHTLRDQLGDHWP